MTLEEHIAKAKAAEHLIIIGEESVIQSWARDTYSFGAMLGGAYVNHAYLGGSSAIAFFIGLSWLIWMISKASREAEKHTVSAAQFREICKRAFAE
jgi:hypothetical protein